MHTRGCTALRSEIRELSTAGPMIGSIQGAMRTRRLLIGPALLLPSRAGFFCPLRRRSKPIACYTGQPLRARRMTDRS
jgi:hypothetical protein